MLHQSVSAALVCIPGTGCLSLLLVLIQSVPCLPTFKTFPMAQVQMPSIGGRLDLRFQPISARKKPVTSIKGQLSLVATVSDRPFKDLVNDIFVSIDCGLLVALQGLN